MQVTYSQAGVDIGAGDRAVELMRSAVGATHNADVIGGVGGFAGLIDASALKDYTRPLLATSTDGVGTKVAIAQALDKHDTIGQDLVAMVVDDIVVVGARPLLMTDYIACGKVIPERISAIVSGIARACADIHTPLLGGETAEHPGLLGEDEYDLAGAVTGVVEADKMLGPDRVRAGDAIVAMAASGLHSNGYSLVRKVVEVAGLRLTDEVPEFGRTLGEELLEPTRLYTNPVLAMVEEAHAFCHVTGGGLAANLARVIPAGLIAEVERWDVPPVFSLIARAGRVPTEDIEATLNLGVGMLAILPADRADRAIEICHHQGVEAWRAGTVISDDGGEALRGAKGVSAGGVRLLGSYTGL
ncbi:MAG: phosphoribosylformylglycinamidine cyclo-ligase [Flaviflexus sp.]|nr:phosphoribosylformylglycinamidine cyclo-ligase [Flaviflexus sp.]